VNLPEEASEQTSDRWGGGAIVIPRGITAAKSVIESWLGWQGRHVWMHVWDLKVPPNKKLGLSHQKSGNSCGQQQQQHRWVRVGRLGQEGYGTAPLVTKGREV